MKIVKIIFYTVTLILCAFFLVKLSLDGHPIEGVVMAFWLLFLVKGGFYVIDKKEEKYYIPHIPHQQSQQKHDEPHNKYEQEKKKDEQKESRKYDDSKKEDNKKNKYENNSEEYFFCSILNINKNSSIDSIKSAYKDEIKKYHPDKVEHLGNEFKEIAEKKTKDINEAYNYFRKKYGF